MMIQTDTLNEFPVFDSVKNGKAGGLPGGSVVKVAQMVKNLPAIQETWVQTLGWEDALEKGRALQYPLQYPGLENSILHSP